MKRKHYIITGVTLAVLLCAYLGLWIYSAQWFGHEIDRLYAKKDSDGMDFLGPKPILTNFPFVPQVAYNGGVKTGNTEILFPQMIVRGYPIPGTKLHVTFPLGISLAGIVDPKIWNLSTLEADVVIPYSLPQSFEYEDLAQWHKDDGKIDVRHYKMTKSELEADGKGLLSLDDDLQPVFTLQSTMRGHDAFIQSQVDKGLIEPFPGAIGMTMLNGLSKTDEKTGQKSVTLTVSVENRMLRVGPLQALHLPEIAWDKRNPPVQPQ